MKYLFTLSILMFSTATAFAHSSVECTKEDKAKWQNEAAFKKNLEGQQYKIKKFKVTKGNCYEIYGFDKDGKKVEIYFNPVTGEKVKEEIH